MTYRILIVDDNPVIRRSLRSGIEEKTDWQICGEAEDGKIAIDRVAELNPDIVILDLQMPLMNGLEAAREIARIAPNTSMVMFTMYSSDLLLKAARAAGIADVFSKSAGLPEKFFSTIRSILESRNSEKLRSESPAAD